LISLAVKERTGNPMHCEPPSRGTIEQQAADWLSRRERGFAPEEQAAFGNWLLDDPRHAAAARQMEASWRFLQKPLRAAQGAELLQEIDLLVSRRSRRRQQLLGWSFAAFATAAVLVLTFVPFRPRETAAPIAQVSVREKPDRLELPDGSIVELNAQAEIVPDFSATRRNVQLVAGTALFTVAKDPTRPFVVTMRDVAVRAVGTEFCVQLDPKNVDVLVTEGRVIVERTASSGGVTEPPTALVSVDHRVLVPLDAPAAVLQVQSASPQAIQRALRWRNQRFEFTDVPLNVVAQHFNQQNEQKLEIDIQAAEVRVSGIYWLDDPEGFSRLIAASAGLQAIPVSSRRIILRKP
jgi:transmembrane sensor